LAFVASLVPVSAAAAVIARSLRLAFDGAAQIGVPALTLPAAQWIGEGHPIPVSQGTTSPGAVIVPHKLAVLIALTGEMIRHTNAEALVRQVLIEAVGATLDLAMFSTAAEVPGLRPAGILAGVSALTSAGGMVKDIAQIAEALAPVAGSNGGAVLVAAPAQAVSLTLGAARDFWPVLASAALPAGTVIGLVPTALATVVETPRIEASGDAVVHRADPASEAVDVGGVMATPLVSMWQTDSVSERLILPCSWARRSASAVAFIQGATW
jgi:hypothetical protein